MVSTASTSAMRSEPFARGAAVKRALDVVGCILILPIVLLPMIAIALAIWLVDGGPVLFRHTRIGRDGRPFECLKFRTMVRDSSQRLADYLNDNPEAREEWVSKQKLMNDPRIIPGIGTLLRKTSLDELPQIFNILSGDMGLVGPRPVTEQELEHYGRQVGWYLAVRPGLTGAWQISGRSDTTYAERVRLDVDYVQRWSLFRDIRILLATFSVAVTGKGAA